VILETVRAVADWFADPVHGVDAALAALPYEAGESAPSQPLSIYDETRREEAALGTALAVDHIRIQAGAIQSLDGQSATYTHDADIPLEFLIARRKTDADDALRDGYYTVRAVLQVIERLFDGSAASSTATARNGVQLQVILSLSAGRSESPLGDTHVTMAVLCTLRVRDTLA
jgi:hypothetical protein